jgi:hypothetical protein
MSSTAFEVAKFLAASGAGTFAGATGWSINVSREPVNPPTAVTVYDTGGEGPDTDEQDLLVHNFQIRVRAPNYANAYAKHEEMRALLIGPDSIVMEGTRYVGVWVASDILAIGRDEGDRHLLTANYRAIKELN